MDTIPCKFYRAGSVSRVSLDFMDAEVGRLVSVENSSDTSSALVIDSNGLFVVTMPALIKITGADTESVLMEIAQEIKTLASHVVAPCNTYQFNRDVDNLIHRIWKKNKK